MTPDKLRSRIKTSAFAFRGYNYVNLGRSYELLAHKVYGPIVEEQLNEASEALSPAVGRPLNLVDRVRQQEETSLETYADAIVLVVAMELAQLRIAKEYFGIEFSESGMAMGYSLGEVAALIASGVVEYQQALQIPVSLADDCVALAADVTLAVLFSRGLQLPMEAIHRECALVNAEANGVIGISAILSPNSIILLGQNNTLSRLKQRVSKATNERLFLRRNEHRWPPLHTPIVWQRLFSDRCAQQMLTMPTSRTTPKPRVFSLVTGGFSYNDYNVRDILHRWCDQPQRLWDAVYATCDSNIDTIVHVGPSPNIIPATFNRLSENVTAQMANSFSLRAISNFVSRPWLKRLLPAQSALLRAPMIEQVILEDWLLAQTF